MTFTTETGPRRSPFATGSQPAPSTAGGEDRWRAGRGARNAGAVLCGLGLALLIPVSLVSSALGIELLAAAFWVWARAAEDASEQVPRWAWLRRPAMAMWLAVALHAAFPAIHDDSTQRTSLVILLSRIEAGAVAWAGLELLAALPQARPFSDVSGPLLALRTWLPVMLPAAGFMVLWKHAAHAFGVPEIQRIAVPLLLVTTTLAALSAFARRSWSANLRWLVITDCALAALVVASGVVPATSSLLLWLAAFGGHAFLLAGELRGAFLRRGQPITRLWRAASWAALAALSWPALVSVGRAQGGWFAFYYVGIALPVALTAWITVARVVAAPERRLMSRPNPALAAGQAGALITLVVASGALLRAWWGGFDPSLSDSVLALGPALLGGLFALAARQGRSRPLWILLRRAGSLAPPAAGGLFRFVVRFERGAIALLERVVRAAAVPLHDLHTGDAQEYLLFLVGLAVLALTVPLLQ